MLDQEVIEGHGIQIAGRRVADADLAVRTGLEVATELGGRYLLRYMLYDQINEFTAGSNAPHWVTPTPLATAELPSFLALPTPTGLRRHVLALSPAAIPEVRGPRWVRGGKGIEYLLPHGFPHEALVVVDWELEVT